MLIRADQLVAPMLTVIQIITEIVDTNYYFCGFLLNVDSVEAGGIIFHENRLSLVLVTVSKLEIGAEAR